MKKYLLLLCCFTFSLFSVEVMKPFKGSPNMIGRSSLTFGNNTIKANFKLPPGWGIGESHFSQNGKGNFLLFPSHGGFGCDVTIDHMQSEQEVNEKMLQIQRTFSSVKQLSNGFEWSDKRTFFCCQKQGNTLVQICYPLKKATNRDKKIWELLKKSITIEKPDNSSSSFSSEELVAPLNKSMESYPNHYVFHSPNNKTTIIVKKDRFLDPFKINRNENFQYKLEVDDMRSNIKGFFYIDWEVDSNNINNSYKNFITNIEKEIIQIDQSQQQLEPIVYSPDETYALYKGNPYYILVVRAKDSMFGFATTPKVDFMGYSFNDLLKKIQWSK